MTLLARGSLFLYALLIFLTWVYLRSWWTLPAEVYVIQCKVEDFHSGLLRERQPVVVTDHVLRPLELCSISLRHHYLFHRTGVTVPHERWSTAALVTFFRPGDPAVLHAASEHAAITFRLQGGEVLVLPAHWHVTCDVACDVVEAYDVSHTLFKPIRLLCDRDLSAAATKKDSDSR